MLTTVEKVIFLQDIDIFESTTTENLAHIATITEEIEFNKDKIVFKEGEFSDALYLVIDGQVRLERENKLVMIAKGKDVFGTWALFDDEPRVVTATTLEDTHLLKIDKEDFFDLLADHVQITQGILKTMTKRLRGLMARVGL
jgi:CRP/FNR family cyclic AMP-dependent transcriptional regulator